MRAREQKDLPDWSRASLIGGAVLVAIIGSVVHNAREFGLVSVLVSRNGELPILLVWGAAYATWWRVPRLRSTAAWGMVSVAVLNLVGGAVISVLPLSILPFYPEQSMDHYLSHIIYGITQIPLVLVGVREATSQSRPVR